MEQDIQTANLHVSGSENIQVKIESYTSNVKLRMIDPNGVGGTLSYFGTGDTFGIGQSTTHNDLANFN